MKTILTLTLSPAVDVEYHTDTVRPGLHRSTSHTVTAGGKGIRVSEAIGRLLMRRIRLPEPVELVTAAPVGGAAGELLQKLAEEAFIPLTVFPIDGETRINVSVLPEDGTEPLEVNAPGTPIGEARTAIGQQVDTLGEGDILILSGSCPADVEPSYPAELCRRAKKNGALCVLDISGEALRLAVASDVPPDVIKPNRDELEELAGHSLPDRQAMAAFAETLPVPLVITTLAAEGAMLTRLYKDYPTTTVFPAEKKTAVRLKGAGDTFLGAFVYARFAAGMDDAEAMRFASDFASCYVAGD